MYVISLTDTKSRSSQSIVDLSADDGRRHPGKRISGQPATTTRGYGDKTSLSVDHRRFDTRRQVAKYRKETTNVNGTGWRVDHGHVIARRLGGPRALVTAW